MCTVVILRRPGHAWSLLLAANRDERLDRAWDPPAAHWPNRRGVVGGRDATAGGTWQALSPRGVVAAVLNRPGSLGPAAGKRSRGELPLLALEAESAAAGAARVATLDASDWRPFNLVIADAASAWFVRGTGSGRAEAMPLPAGISMVTAHDPNDLGSPRTRRHLPRFRAVPPPVPERGDWESWTALLRDGSYDPAIGRAETLAVPPTNGFGTVCSSLLALGAGGERQWLFAAAAGAAFTPVVI
ncbi:hypothetical protein GXW71_14715 [Roseomonas hellenica]|uniref:Transport and Golgi organization protein 2 n=1 Tax=Plastoroseomonas hellenica TaxID=2687306 RepID=A0ABS5EZ90_9PROT|nr:NRDE family protein [Plastoroseomonas hellenica]MBR0665609.1 hypothetical protein [Plastoroseomonas hellenica]